MTGPVRDFVLDTTTTGGTGAMTLAGNPPLGFKGFDAYPDGAVVFYARRGDPQDVDAGKIETGRGTVGVSGTVTLTRDQVFESSNNDELVTWTEGVVSHVFVFVPAAMRYSRGMPTLSPFTGRAQAASKSGTGLSTEVESLGSKRGLDVPPRGDAL